MKKALRAIGLTAAAFLVLAPATAGAQDGEGDEPVEVADPEAYQQLADDFQAELEALLADVGQDPSGVPNLVGEAGDWDLPPGELVVTRAIADIETAPLPDGGGSSLAGPCQGIAMSFDDNGEVIDIAVDFDEAAPPVDMLASGSSIAAGEGDGLTQAFTSGNPFQVHVNGFVAYAGLADPPPTNHTWFINVQGLGDLDSGGDDNPDLENRNAGVVDLKNDLPAPAKVNALFRIDGSMNADSDFRCTGDGYFQTIGGMPLLAVGGLVLTLAAGFGALFNARPAMTWKG